MLGKFLLLRIRQARIGHHGPEHDGETENDRARLLDILPRPLPGMDQESPECRQSVRGQLHDKGRFGASEQDGSNELGREQGEEPGKQRQGKHHLGLVFGEEGRDQHGEYGEFRPTVHKRYDQQGCDSLPGVS